MVSCEEGKERKVKNQGFTFLELLIGITITSMLSIVLFTSYNQTHRSSVNLEKMISLDIRVTVIQNQFDKDISGVFAPDVTEIKPEPEKKQTSEATRKSDKEQKESKELREKQENEKPQKEEAKRFLEKTFYTESKGKTISELTFITCNPLLIYGLNEQSKPRIARVTYTLKEDRFAKGSFSLFRKESHDLKYGADKNTAEYEVANGIKDLNMEFIIPDPEQKDSDKKSYKIFNEWKFDNKTKKDNPYVIPLYVNVKITFWEDTEQTLEQKFEFKYFVFAFDSQLPKKKKASDSKIQDIFKEVEKLRAEAGIKTANENTKQQEKK